MASRASTAVTADETQRVRRRRRAPRRTGGHRAQLTVPEEMWVALTDVAEALGTTPNDALVRLAAERLDDRRRELALQQLAAERWRAFTNASRPAGEASTPLSEQELVALSGAFRADS
jgi:hypothetical protein